MQKLGLRELLQCLVWTLVLSCDLDLGLPWNMLHVHPQFVQGSRAERTGEYFGCKSIMPGQCRCLHRNSSARMCLCFFYQNKSSDLFSDNTIGTSEVLKCLIITHLEEYMSSFNGQHIIRCEDAHFKQDHPSKATMHTIHVYLTSLSSCCPNTALHSANGTSSAEQQLSGTTA